MSKYKVGDVAALFSKSKEPTTESGKKLQALFQQFQSKNKKDSSQITEKRVNNFNEGREKNQRVLKKEKKRKFSAIKSEETDEVNNTKKFKKVENEVPNSTKLKGKHFLTELDFPRKKKSSKANKNNLKNYTFNSFGEKEDALSDNIQQAPDGDFKSKMKSNELDFPRKKKSSKANKDNLMSNNTFNSFGEKEDALSDNIQQAPDGDFKSKMKSNDKKKIPNFIRKSKQQRQAAINGAVKSKDSEIMSDKFAQSLMNQINLFKEDNEEFVEQSAKKKKHSNDSFVQNKNSTDIGGNEMKTLFKKSYGENKQNLQPMIYKKGEPDFIKLPDLKSEDAEERLSRTLFVSNLPIDLGKKALQTLFSPFGEIESIRYHGVETDKAKIFNKNGPKILNPKNYAADSLPAFIVFSDRESAVKALSLTGSLFMGRHITVDFALPSGTKKMYDDKRSIFIGNLPFDCQDESVWEAFSECGRIENVRIVRDKETGIGKGFGYVQFSTVQAKENALGLADLEIQGRTIRIKEVKSDAFKQKKEKNTGPAKIDTFKSRAIKIKKKNKDSTSRKSVKKIMKKQKNLHQKKKNASILQKSMKL